MSMPDISFAVLSSGSKGNSTIIWDDRDTIMIDFGISYRRFRQSVSAFDLPENQISLFISHEHSDHSAGVKTLKNRSDVEVYSRKGTLDSLPLSDGFEIGKTCVVGNFEINSVDISHDAAEPVAYVIRYSDYKITVASDMGIVNDELIRYAAGSDILAFEANHDVDLLKSGSYPVYLKKRILSDVGHLSNYQSSMAISEMASAGTRIILTHLSEENNTPDTALSAVKDYLHNREIQYLSAECADQWKVSSFHTLG